MSEEKADYNPAEHLIKLSGKAYLQVADRIVWFRRDYPEGTIETTIVSIDEERGSAIFRAEVCTGKGGRATATGSETLKDFPQGWIEKSEAKAVGRALGYLGYGTAAAGFEEGNRPVDAPRNLPAPRRDERPQEPRHAPAPAPPPDLDANLLARMQDDAATPEMRLNAVHNYLLRAKTLDDLGDRARTAEDAGIPKADVQRALDWHTADLVAGRPAKKAPAAAAG